MTLLASPETSNDRMIDQHSYRRINCLVITFRHSYLRGTVERCYDGPRRRQGVVGVNPVHNGVANQYYNSDFDKGHIIDLTDACL